MATKNRPHVVQSFWTVDNFLHRGNDYLSTYLSILGSTEQVRFEVRIYPKFDIESFDDRKSKDVAVLLRVVYTDRWALKVCYKVAIVDESSLENRNDVEKAVLYEQEYSCKFDQTNTQHYSKFISRAQLENASNGYINSMNSVTFFTEIELLDLSPAATSQHDLVALSNNLESLYLTQTSSDFTLVISGVAFSVHRFLLAARSPVFAVMLSNDMIENANGRAEIADIEATIGEKMLHFLYTGRVDGLDVYAVELFKAADKYQIKSLKIITVGYLKASLTVDSVRSVYQLAELYGDEELLGCCQVFMNENGMVNEPL